MKRSKHGKKKTFGKRTIDKSETLKRKTLKKKTSGKKIYKKRKITKQRGGHVNILQSINSHVIFQDTQDTKDNLTKYHNLSLPPLSANVFQWLINNNNISYYLENKGSESSNWRQPNPEYHDYTLIGFNNFPLYVDNITSSFKESKSRGGQDFTKIIEDGDIELLSREDHYKNLLNNIFKINANVKENSEKIIIKQDVLYLNKLMNRINNQGANECDFTFPDYDIDSTLEVENLVK